MLLGLPPLGGKLLAIAFNLPLGFFGHRHLTFGRGILSTHSRHLRKGRRRERAREAIGITGVAGFIGSNLADRLLAEGYDVVGFDNLAYGVREQIPDGVAFQQVDIRGREIYELFGGLDVLFHLAAKNCIADCQDDPLETSDINVTGTVNVFEAARRADVGKVVYAESSALYEGSRSDADTRERRRAAEFLRGQQVARNGVRASLPAYYGLRTTALRYFGVYGPRQDTGARFRR